MGKYALDCIESGPRIRQNWEQFRIYFIFVWFHVSRSQLFVSWFTSRIHSAILVCVLTRSIICWFLKMTNIVIIYKRMFPASSRFACHLLFVSIGQKSFWWFFSFLIGQRYNIKKLRFSISGFLTFDITRSMMVTFGKLSVSLRSGFFWSCLSSVWGDCGFFGFSVLLCAAVYFSLCMVIFFWFVLCFQLCVFSISFNCNSLS